MAKKNTYRVICKTDLYNANRYAGFNKQTGIKVCETGLTLKVAQERLLTFLNMVLADEGYSSSERWRKNTSVGDIELFSYSDGTRAFTIDIFTYSVEKEETDND